MNDQEIEEIGSLAETIRDKYESQTAVRYRYNGDGHDPRSIPDEIVNKIRHPVSKIISITIWTNKREVIQRLHSVLLNTLDIAKRLDVKYVFHIRSDTIDGSFISFGDDGKPIHRGVSIVIRNLLYILPKDSIEGFVLEHTFRDEIPEYLRNRIILQNVLQRIKKGYFQYFKRDLYEWIEPIHCLPLIVFPGNNTDNTWSKQAYHDVFVEPITRQNNQRIIALLSLFEQKQKQQLITTPIEIFQSDYLFDMNVILYIVIPFIKKEII
jgi:hypothetical protein